MVLRLPRLSMCSPTGTSFDFGLRCAAKCSAVAGTETCGRHFIGQFSLFKFHFLHFHCPGT
jgi:hypothetical protein